MTSDIVSIVEFIVEAFLHIWPYLLVTIPIAVAVQMSGASQYINRAFQGKPVISILLATAVGAFSPLCSCGVIPVISALLIGGVPIAPVMSFWIASPSMDPEAFFLSVATLGWELAVWRLVTTLILSLSAGFITHALVRRGWLGAQLLRQGASAEKAMFTLKNWLRDQWQALQTAFTPQIAPVPVPAVQASSSCGCGESTSVVAAPVVMESTASSCCSSVPVVSTCCEETITESDCGCSTQPSSDCGCGSEAATTCGCDSEKQPSAFWQRLGRETLDATLMVVKFMALAFLLEALIELYVPEGLVAGIVGQDNPFAILTAALLGVPAYTGTLSALPMIGGLLAQGMNPAAALAFLVAGPTTTLPAMAAVWGIANRRVFALYVSFSLVGALVAGYLFQIVSQL